MRIKNILPAAVIIMFTCLAGCEKPVHRMDAYPVRKRLVLNGSFGPDQAFRIHISSSMEPVGPELADLVDDAEISVSCDNEISIYPQHDSMGFYLADWHPQENSSFRINVSAAGFGDAQAYVSIPGRVDGVSISAQPSNTKYPYILKFTDGPEPGNTYMIRSWYQYKEIRNLFTSNNVWIHDTLIERRAPLLNSDDEMIKYSADGNTVGDSEMPAGDKSACGFLVADELFNGKDHTMNFKATYVRNLDPDRPYLFVEILSLKREFYNYVRSYCLYYKSRQAPFAEPVAILSNVDGGLGFVYGYSVTTDSIRIGQNN